MALIDGLIAQQNYELVRARIGLILATELENQTLQGNYEADAEVWVERVIPFSQTDLPVVNVCLAGGVYDNQTVKHVDGTYTFNIDCHTSSKTTGTANEQKADHLALLKLQRLLGICRAILSDAQYATLNFARPFIMSRQVKNLNIANADMQDTTMTVWGRLQVEIRIPETVELLTPTDVALYETSVKLFETELGYVFRTNVTP